MDSDSVWEPERSEISGEGYSGGVESSELT